MNKYEKAYKLETEKGITAFLNDYPRLQEARFYASDLSISDLLLDFHFAFKKALTDRQKEVVTLVFFKDMKQSDVAAHLGLSQQTIQEHTVKAIKNLATYHLLRKEKVQDNGY